MKSISVWGKAVIFFAVIIISTAGCRERVSGSKYHHPYVSVRDQQFIDTVGRNLILHGLNLVNKDPEQHYLGSNDREIFRKMKGWGFNCVRLGVIWDGLEPEPGVYDKEYLQGIDDRIRWAAENNIYVILDMHQDLYSVLFSDGAPEWATLTEDKPHITGEIWSEAYFLSPAVQTAFDNFWANAPASDGTGVQDHFIEAWKHLAERFAGYRNVAGYDLMNEPFPGSAAVRIMPSLMQTYASVMAEKEQKPLPTEEELANIWTSVEGRAKVYKDLSDTSVFSRVFEAIYSIQAPFEEDILTPFYQKTRDAIREVDPYHIIFIEHAIYGNSGTRSAIQPLTDASGRKDTLVAYAPHGYDLVTDTDIQEASSLNRVGFIFERIYQSGNRLDMPVLVGEWGAFYGNQHQAVVNQADFIINEYERRLFSHTYWSYFNELEKMPYFSILKRPYPMAVSGKLGSYDFDPKKRVLEVEWLEKTGVTTPTRIYIDDIEAIQEGEITLNPLSDYKIEPIKNTGAGYLMIAASNEMNRKLLKIKFR